MSSIQKQHTKIDISLQIKKAVSLRKFLQLSIHLNIFLLSIHSELSKQQKLLKRIQL